MEVALRSQYTSTEVTFLHSSCSPSSRCDQACIHQALSTEFCLRVGSDLWLAGFLLLTCQRLFAARPVCLFRAGPTHRQRNRIGRDPRPTLVLDGAFLLMQASVKPVRGQSPIQLSAAVRGPDVRSLVAARRQFMLSTGPNALHMCVCTVIHRDLMDGANPHPEQQHAPEAHFPMLSHQVIWRLLLSTS